MKNNFLTLTHFLYFLFIICLINLYTQIEATESQNIVINAKVIESFDKGNLLKATQEVEIIDKSGLIINSDKLEFDKKKSVLKIKKNVEINDTIKDYIINANEVIYYKNLNLIKTIGKTKIKTNTNHIIVGSDIEFDRNLNKIYSKNKTIITDDLNNKFFFNEFEILIVNKILKTNYLTVIDNKSNKYTLEKAVVNLDIKEVLGKDLTVNLNNEYTGSSENQPRIKGNSVILDNKNTIINKGVFTTCKIKDDCPPWTLSAEKINHDRNSKNIHYDNAILRVYNVPVFYFPKFFHPDPSVKRQSGFLIPKYGQSSSLGNYLSLPYYHVIKENSDLTFSPRLYEDKSIYQGEYRIIKKDFNSISDLSFKNDNFLIPGKKKFSSHFFSKTNLGLKFDNFDDSELNLKIESTSNDQFLKQYKLKSPLIVSNSVLHSNININASREDLNLQIFSESYEKLGLSNGDKYEYILPGYNFSKKILDNEKGTFKLMSSGVHKQYNTNVNEKTMINDFNFKSHRNLNLLGVVQSYEMLIKNFNAKGKNSNTIRDKSQNAISSIINYEAKLPLINSKGSYEKLFIPKMSFRYSPNKTKNISSIERFIDYDNLFSLNRIGSNSTVETGGSFTLGSEFFINNNNTKKEIFSSKFGASFRDKENFDLPLTSSLSRKSSDIFGEFNFVFNKFLDFKYDFALDNNLDQVNHNKISSIFTINNIVSTFELSERNNFFGNGSYFSNETKLLISDNNSLSFKTRKNKDTDLTEYYKMIYEYKNDCLVASLEYNKDYYTDGILQPDEEVFLSLTIMPFGKANSPKIIRD